MSGRIGPMNNETQFSGLDTQDALDVWHREGRRSDQTLTGMCMGCWQVWPCSAKKIANVAADAIHKARWSNPNLEAGDSDCGHGSEPGECEEQAAAALRALRDAVVHDRRSWPTREHDGAYQRVLDIIDGRRP